jgi:hypothetical protein
VAQRRNNITAALKFDCTHMCLHSDATFAWLEALERTVCRFLRPSRGRVARRVGSSGRKS